MEPFYLKWQIMPLCPTIQWMSPSLAVSKVITLSQQHRVMFAVCCWRDYYYFTIMKQNLYIEVCFCKLSTYYLPNVFCFFISLGQYVTGANWHYLDSSIIINKTEKVLFLTESKSIKTQRGSLFSFCWQVFGCSVLKSGFLFLFLVFTLKHVLNGFRRKTWQFTSK